MNFIFIAFIFLAIVGLCITAAVSVPYRLRIWWAIYPLAVVAALIGGFAIGLGAGIAASHFELFPPCGGGLCELGQFFSLIAATMAFVAVAMAVALIVFGKRIATLAKTRRVLWIVAACVIGIPTTAIAALFTVIGALNL